MKFSFTKLAPNQEKTDCLLIGVYKNQTLTPIGKALDKSSNQFLSKLLKIGDFKAEIGQNYLLSNIVGIKSHRVVLVGLGDEANLDELNFIKVIKQAFLFLKGLNCHDATCFLTDAKVKNCDFAKKVLMSTIYSQDALYVFDKHKSEKTTYKIKHIYYYCEKPGKQEKEALLQGQAIANGLCLAKNLGNEPSNVCTPTFLADQAKKLAKDFPHIKTEVLDVQAMKKLGMGALLAVGQGSNEPPKLIIMNYQGGKKSEQPIALVGKGITFDAGGICIKPSAAMDEMKFDMMGAASVMGTLRAIAELELPINVVGIVPSAENMPDGKSYKPADIVTTMSGKTVNIIDTDAEGRLILCDALTYVAKFKPRTVIDIATLTGSIIVALGFEVSGIFANDDKLAKELVASGEDIGDRAWHMPLVGDYNEELKSAYADLNNCGSRWGGAITAACFLSNFTQDFSWAHIDNAGTAWKVKGDIGATGRPIPLLVNYLLKQCHKN